MRTYFFAVLLALWTVPHALAQTGPARAEVGVDSACPTYRECALRMDVGLLGPRIVRGVEGEVVARSGLFGGFSPSVERAVEGSEPAVDLAQRYQQRTRTGRLILLTGFALGVAYELTEHELSDTARAGISVASVGSLLFSFERFYAAQKSLSQALFSYNASLK